MMGTKLYVGNLNYETNENDLETLFSKYGNVKSATVIRDAYSGKSKGFGFVEMMDGDQAEKALEQNSTEFMGRTIVVSEARPPKSRGGEDRGSQSRPGRNSGYGRGQRRY